MFLSIIAAFSAFHQNWFSPLCDRVDTLKW